MVAIANQRLSVLPLDTRLLLNLLTTVAGRQGRFALPVKGDNDRMSGCRVRPKWSKQGWPEHLGSVGSLTTLNHRMDEACVWFAVTLSRASGGSSSAPKKKKISQSI